MISEHKRAASDRRGHCRKPKAGKALRHTAQPKAGKALRRTAQVGLLVVISAVLALGLSCGGTPLGSPDMKDGSDAGGVSSPETPPLSEPDAEDCANGIDDDGDGGADCDDTDCHQRNVCKAPPLDQSAPSNTADMVEFLYTGADPIQKAVDPTIFAPERIAVLRGQVLDQAGAPLSGMSRATSPTNDP